MHGAKRLKLGDRAVVGRAVYDDVLELDTALGIGGFKRPPDGGSRVPADRDERYPHSRTRLLNA